MADTYSFDIVSQIDMQEAVNAIEQAKKEIAQRYDFRGSKASVELNSKDKTLALTGDTEYQLQAVVDVVQAKLIKRGVSIKALKYGKVESAGGGTVRQTVTLQSGIDKENSKKVTDLIKKSGLKVQAAIMDDIVRITAKSKDDLQAVQQAIREADFEFASQYTNYR